MSEFDAVDGYSTGTRVPWMWVLLRLPRFGGAHHANGHDNRFRYCEVGFFHVHGIDAQGKVMTASAEASPRLGVLPKASAVPGLHRSLRLRRSKMRRLRQPHRLLGA
jgi:hypothetical protein